MLYWHTYKYIHTYIRTYVRTYMCQLPLIGLGFRWCYLNANYAQTSLISESKYCCFLAPGCQVSLRCFCVAIECSGNHTILQYIPRNMHTVFALLCFVVVILWLIFPYPSGLLHWHCGNLTIAQVPAKQPWWIWINTSSEFIMNDCITTTKQSTTKPCAYFLGYTVIPV